MRKVFLILMMLCICMPAPSFSSTDTIAHIAHIMRKPVAVIDQMSLAHIASKDTPRTQAVRILATGDMMFHMPQITWALDRATGTYDFSHSFSEIAPWVQAADFAMANFEAAAAGSSRPYTGYPLFNAPDETLVALKEAGFDFFSTANNHAFDAGLYGVDRTLDIMKEMGFGATGTFHDDHRGNRFETVTIEGITFGIAAATYGLNGFELAYSPETIAQKVNMLDEEALEALVRSMCDANHDVNILYIHWGHEYHSRPNAHQLDLAEKLFDWGIDIILGAHPHVVQPDALYMDGKRMKYVVYSMGNAISNQNRVTMDADLWEPKRVEDGVLIYLDFTKDSFGNVALKHVTPVPTWVHRRYENGRLMHTVLPAFGSELSSELKDSQERTLRYLKGFRPLNDIFTTLP